MTKLRVLDLFSGIGGFSLGLERTGGFETAAFCEYADFPRKVLAKHWPDVPCFPDVRELKGEDINGPIDVICGGYPCQPFSQAGQRRGKEDDRHLWPEFSRLVDELRPTWVIGENVAGHISMGLDDVLSDLEGQGYACRTFVIPACAVGAPHRRDRVWSIASRNDADADSVRSHRTPKHVIRGREPSDRQVSLFGPFCEVLAGSGGASVGEASDVADADTAGREERHATPIANEPGPPAWRIDAERDFWLTEPDVGRVANGVPRRVDRLKALGNAVVPQIPEMIGHAILQAEYAR
jgi:DNA (cytosine-5)-methyltransferase 1